MTEQNEQQEVQIKLEPIELEMAVRMTRDKDQILKQIGQEFVTLMGLTHQYGSALAGEQQFLQSLQSKYGLHPQALMKFGKDGVLTAVPAPPAPSMPPAEEPPTEDESGESTG